MTPITHLLSRLRRPTRVPGRVWGAVCLAGALAGLAAATPWGSGLEVSLGLDTLFRLRGPRPVEAPVAIVALRRDASERIWMRRDSSRGSPCGDLRVADSSPGEAWMRPPPPTRLATWPRCLHALAVDRLREAGVAAIVFDVLFRAREPGLAGFDVAHDDGLLAEAMRRDGNVVIAQKLEVLAGDQPDGATAEFATLGEAVEAGAFTAAPFPLPGNRDEPVRQAWLFLDTEPPIPTFPVMALAAQASHRGLLPDLLLPRTRPGLPVAQDPMATMSAAHRVLRASPGAAAKLTDRVRAIEDPSDRALAARIVDAAAGPGLRWINFYGPPDTIPTVGLDEVLAAEPMVMAALAGRTVFVGYAETAQAEPQDDHETVFSRDGRNMHGVEIAATAFANLVEKSFVRETSPLVAGAITALAVLLVAGTTVAATPLAGLVAAVVAAALYLAAATRIFAASGLWLPIVWPVAIAVPGAWLAGVLHHYRSATLQRARLSEVFSTVVPRDVVRQLGENAQSLHAVRRDIVASCLATDAHQYTALAERMRSAAVFEFLNRYYEPLFEAVASGGGFVSDVVGDSMAAIWPEGGNGPAVRDQVCGACLRILEGSDELMREQPDVTLLTRIGVAWGPVTLGFVGSVGHYEYRAVGDPVNTANRLQSLAKTLGVRTAMASDLAAGLDDYLWRDLGDFRLRGRNTPLRVVELVGRRTPDAGRRAPRVAEWNAIVSALRAGPAPEGTARLEAYLRSAPDDGPARFWQARARATRDSALMPATAG